jgi:hypothetical protein
LLLRRQLTIVGIVPAQFHGSLAGLSFDLWVPVTMASELNAMPEWMLGERKARLLFGVARLKPGVTVESAAAEAQALSRQLAKANPDSNRGIGAAILPLSKGHFGAQNTLGAAADIDGLPRLTPTSLQPRQSALSAHQPRLDNRPPSGPGEENQHVMMNGVALRTVAGRGSYVL